MRTTRSPLLNGLALAAFGLAGASTETASTVDCSAWTLDGYRLGMKGPELLAVRPATQHVQGQAEVIEQDKFHGVLVVNELSRLEKWDAIYDAPDGEGLRAEMRERYGEPASDVTGTLFEDDSDTVRQRRTIWWSTACDAATLVRPALLPSGIATWKTLFP